MKDLRHYICICISILVLSTGQKSFSQVVINEIAANNSSSFPDEDGDFNDWIELFNAGNYTIDLQGYGLSDNPKEPFKWEFESQKLNPNEYLVVMASGKNRQSNEVKPDTLESLLAWFSASSIDTTNTSQVVKRDNTWFVSKWNSNNSTLYASQNREAAQPTLIINQNHNRPAIRFNGTSQFLKTNVMPPTGNNARTIVIVVDNTNTETANQLYRNYIFQYGHYNNAYAGFLTSKSHGNRIGMHYWYDSFLGDGQVNETPAIISFQYDGQKDQYYINGRFCGSYSVTLNTSDKEPLTIASRFGNGMEFYGGDILELLVFNEAIDPQQLRRIENHLALKNGLLTTPFHTNYKISSSGEVITLTSPDNQQSDQVIFPGVELVDVTYGRTNNGWSWFTTASPGKANSLNSFNGISRAPEASHKTGFYSDSILLTLHTNDPQAVIYYTLDGSLPDTANLNGKKYPYKSDYTKPGIGTSEFRTTRTYRYISPLTIKPFTDTSGNLAALQASELKKETLNNPIPRATIIRAAAIKDGELMSPVVSYTYFIDTLDYKRFNLPVISVIMDEADLFNYENGIYVRGKYYDIGINEGRSDANYFRGELEYPGHFSLLDANGNTTFESNAGVKIHGKFSTQWPRKSLKLKAQRKYGAESQFEYPFFNQLRQNPKVGRDSVYIFNKLNLRNSGIKWQNNLFHDAIIHELCKNYKGSFQAAQPLIHLLNGEFWGIMNLREEFDQYYFSEHYAMDPNDVIIINGAYMTVNEGYDYEIDEYRRLESYVDANPLTISSNFEYIKSKIDIECYLYHFMTEIYVRNTDFINNNRKAWKKRTDKYEPGAPYGHDGRWRWISYDYDLTLQQPDEDNLNDVTLKNTHRGTLLLRKLLENDEAKRLFINQFCDLMNTSFLPEYAEMVFDSMALKMNADLPAHILRWGHPDPTQRKAEMMDFIIRRPSNMITHLKTRFGLNDTVSVRLTVNGKGGHIQINNTPLDSSTPRADMSQNVYPWTGIYFKDVPVKLTAVPSKGFKFSNWSNGSTSDTIWINPKDINPISANFIPASPATDSLVISEINYNALSTADPGDWIELFNPNSFPQKLGGWYLSDESGNSYIFPEDSYIEANGFVVVAENKKNFQEYFKGIVKLYGNMGFGLSGSGEKLQLFDRNDNRIDLVNYDDKSPWPLEADGKGSVMVLKNYKLDNNNGENWFASRGPGTPGKENEPFFATGLSSNSLHKSLSIYPNPATNAIRIDHQDDQHYQHIKIFNQIGMLMMEFKGNDLGSQEIDISSLSSGIYFIRIISANNEHLSGILMKK